MNRVNITIDKSLHAKAVEHAKQQHYTGFSGLVVKLILEDLERAKGSALGEVVIPQQAAPKKRKNLIFGQSGVFSHALRLIFRQTHCHTKTESAGAKWEIMGISIRATYV